MEPENIYRGLLSSAVVALEQENEIRCVSLTESVFCSLNLAVAFDAEFVIGAARYVRDQRFFAAACQLTSNDAKVAQKTLLVANSQIDLERYLDKLAAFVRQSDATMVMLGTH